MLTKIDTDHDGTVSCRELCDGANKVREFRQYLQILDIDDNDLDELFGMIDYDGSGEVDPDEFIEALYRIKTTEPKTATRFVKYMVQNLVMQRQCFEEQLDAIQEQAKTRFVDIESQVVLGLEETCSPGKVDKLFMGQASEIDKTVACAIEKAVAASFESFIGAAERTKRK